MNEDFRQEKNKVPVGLNKSNPLYIQEQEDPPLHDSHIRQDQSQFHCECGLQTLESIVPLRHLLYHQCDWT